MHKNIMAALLCLSSGVACAGIQLECVVDYNKNTSTHQAVVNEGEKAVWQIEDLMIVATPAAEGDEVTVNLELYKSGDEQELALLLNLC